MASVKDLEQRIAELEARIAQAYGLSAPPPLIVKKEDRLDYIEHGSLKHAEFLGLEKDDSELGWRLMDPTRWGMMARPEMLLEILRQKVAEWKAGPPPPVQSVDRRKPHYAPPIWEPEPELI